VRRQTPSETNQLPTPCAPCSSGPTNLYVHVSLF
jgi:hypothetical protein